MLGFGHCVIIIETLFTGASLRLFLNIKTCSNNENLPNLKIWSLYLFHHLLLKVDQGEQLGDIIII